MLCHGVRRDSVHRSAHVVKRTGVRIAGIAAEPVIPHHPIFQRAVAVCPQADDNLLLEGNSILVQPHIVRIPAIGIGQIVLILQAVVVTDVVAAQVGIRLSIR